MKNKFKNKIKTSLLIGVAIGVGLLFTATPPHKVSNFLPTVMLAGASSFVLLLISDKLEISKPMKNITIASFLARVLIGLLLFILLPIHGYDEPYANQGYLYLDAFERDSDAWELAQSDESISSAFKNEFSTDQYGGLLSLSALIYRFISPNAHQPMLIVIITSFFSAIGLPFLWISVEKRWNKRIANSSSVIYAFYPEGLILGASQMREPLLIGLSAVVFWSILHWKKSKKTAIAIFLVSMVGIVLVSTKIAAAIVGISIIWFWVEYINRKKTAHIQLITGALILAGICLVFLVSWGWLIDSARWDLLLMERASGRIQWELGMVSNRYRVPFIVGYGLAQPVLPAAIVYPGIPITRSIAIFRSIGWYALIPLLVCAPILVFQSPKKGDIKTIIFFILIVFIWTLISSARAGGDQWDNPRYRAILLVWMAVLGGWAWITTKMLHSKWLLRIALVELINIIFLLQWYMSRYFRVFSRLNFWVMVQWLIGISAAIIIGGFISDFLRHKKNQIV